MVEDTRKQVLRGEPGPFVRGLGVFIAAEYALKMALTALLPSWVAPRGARR